MKSKTNIEELSRYCAPDYIDRDIALIDDTRTLPFGSDDGLLEEMGVILFVRSGRLSLKVDGETSVLTPRHIMVCRPGHILADPEFSDDFSGHAIVLTLRFGQSIINVAGNIWSFLLSIDSSPILELMDSTRELLRSYYSLIKSEIKHTQNMFYSEVVSSIIKSMLYSLISDMRQEIRKHQIAVPQPDAKAASSSQTLVIFHKFIDILINEHCIERKIDYYAKRLCITPKYLSSVCKQVSHRTAHEWICDAIVVNIDNYLRYSEKSIKEISVHFGFSTLSFFSKFVKEHLGQPPSAFRR